MLLRLSTSASTTFAPDSWHSIKAIISISTWLQQIVPPTWSARQHHHQQQQHEAGLGWAGTVTMCVTRGGTVQPAR